MAPELLVQQPMLRLGAPLLLLSVLGCGGTAGPASPDATTGADAGRGADAGSSADASSGADGGTTLEACFDGLAPRQAGRFVEVLSLRQDPAGARLILAREPGDRPGAVGETWPFDLVRFAIETAEGARHCLTSPAALEYSFGHHNWDERARVVIGDRAYVITLKYFFNGQAAWVDQLNIHDAASGALISGPLPLVAEACRSIPTDPNACFAR